MNDIHQFFSEQPLTPPLLVSTRSSTSSASVLTEDVSTASKVDIALGLVYSPESFETLDPKMAGDHDPNFPLDHVSTSPGYSDLAKSPQVPLRRFSEQHAMLLPNNAFSNIQRQNPHMQYDQAPPPVFPSQESYWPAMPSHPWNPALEPHPQSFPTSSSSSSSPLAYPVSQSLSILNQAGGSMPSPEVDPRPYAYPLQQRLPSMTHDQLLTFKAGYEMGLSQKSSINDTPPSPRGYQSTFNQHRRSSRRLSKTSSSASTPSMASLSMMSVPPSPTASHISRGSSYATIPENSSETPDVEFNPDVPNEYMWLSVPRVTQGLKDEVIRLAIDKRLKNAGNEQIPDVNTVSSIIDSFSQSHLSLKLTIMNVLYGDSSDPDTHRATRLPKLTIRETDDSVDVLIQTSNGIDLARPDFINTALTGLRSCPVLRNQLCKTSIDLMANIDKRPHNSWFLYRGAQMNRASILKLTECLPNDYEALVSMKEALLYGIGVDDKEAYIAHLREKYQDPHNVKTDLTALGYVVSYMWSLESTSVKRKLTEFSRVEHAHKLKVFPRYKYAPKKPRKRASSS